LAEDQIPKKKKEVNLEKDLDRILDDYDAYKDLNNRNSNQNNYTNNTSKKFIWGYPKKNPNAPKKYYSKKDKK
jgi:lysyl-tRNA synthetase class I